MAYLDQRDLDRLRIDAAESTSAALCAVDATGCIVWHNDQLCRLLGYHPTELIGRRLTHILALSQPGEVVATSVRAALLDGPKRTLVRCKDGSHIDVVIETALVCAAAAPLTIVTLSPEEARPLTDYISRQMVRMNQLDVTQRISGSILHDFNNLLAGISGHALLAKTCASPEEAAAALDEVLRVTQRCSRLVSRLRGGSDRSESEPEGVLWHPIASEALSLLRCTVPPNVNIKLSPEDAPAAARCTESEAHRIVMNLGLNAIDALTDRGGTLAISFRTEWFEGATGTSRRKISSGQYVCLVVEDDGCGMDEATQRSAFEPFFSTKPEGASRGLGLAIVHELVERRDGFVEVDSKVGYGTRFRVYLPTARTPSV